MAETVDNLMLEHLKKIQAEQSASRERDAEILSRLAHIETSVARLARDGADNFAEVIADRHTVDKLKARIERIERRLELQS
jgi:septal ring factor EnvC (AmiA/AmiB activator)